MPKSFYTHRHNGFSLFEVLVSLSVVAFLSLLLGAFVNGAANMRATAANKVVQASIYDIQKSYTLFLSSGAWITRDTHITQIMQNLDTTDVITDASLSINGRSPTVALSCNGTVTCYRLNSGGIVAVRGFSPIVDADSAQHIGSNGYFGPSPGNATEVNGHTILEIIIDPDGVFKKDDPSSASAQFMFDELGRLTPRPAGLSTIVSIEATQATYLDLQK